MLNSSSPARSAFSEDYGSLIEQYGYCQVPSWSMKGILAATYGVTPSMFDSFSASWNHLEPDRFLSDGGKYRLRRFGRARVDAATEQLHALPSTGFFQSKDINPANGGIVRQFADAEPSFMSSPMLAALVRGALRMLPLSQRTSSDWMVTLHQIRIIASVGQLGYPAPEGIHRDGHRYVAQVFIGRSNVAGAESQIYSGDGKNMLFNTTLQDALDTIVIDDRRVMHGVTPVLTADKERPAFRDMLLIDYNLMNS